MYVLNNQALDYKLLYEEYYNYSLDSVEKEKVFLDSAMYYLEKSLNNHRESLEISKELNNVQSEIRSLVNISDIYDIQGKYEEAISVAKIAESKSDKLNDHIILIILNKNLAQSYRHTGQLSKSLKYAKAALKLVNDENMEGYIGFVNDQLYKTYKSMGLIDKALYHLEIMNTQEVKNGKLNQLKAISEVEAKYQTVKKEKVILQQNNELLELGQKTMKYEKQRNSILGGSLILAMIGFFGFRIRKIQKERNDKKAFAEALIFAQEQERKRIARDLHDGVGQSLLLIKKQLEKSHEVTLENRDMISNTLEEVRSISQDLHPFQLEKFGLTASISDVLDKVESSSDLFISKEIESIDGIFDDKAEINIYRTIQEALNNVIKHAEATAAKVSISKTKNAVDITIQDNGKGFDQEIKIETSKSLGLKTMNERITSISGVFNILKGDAGGTIIQMNIPYSPNS